ncbi:mechanosensitive ion channel [Tenacibaculum finnmarkense]|nr:mechanosensitive ion channel [Tenacibaculum finnmarkense]
MLEIFFAAIPKILVATLILIIFVIGGKFLSNLIKDLLDSLNLNEILKSANLDSFTGKANVEKLISNIVYAFIVLFGVMTAIDKLEFSKLSEIMNTVLNLAGNILFGLLILAIGNWIATIASKNFMKSDDNKFVGSIVKVAILAVFLAIGLGKMGIADDIINLAFGITLGAVALTVVLSFGLGGREVGGKQMEKILNKFSKNTNDVADKK